MPSAQKKSLIGSIQHSFFCNRKFFSVCEGTTLNLSCDEGQLLRVSYANYGRTWQSLLVDDCWSPFGWWTNSCSAPSSVDVVKDKCHLKGSCQVEATNSEFGGDPCRFIRKTLFVKYLCVSQCPHQS